MPYPWETRKTVKIVPPGTPGSVRIVHFSNANIDILLEEGLKNRNKLAKEGKVERSTGFALEDHGDNIYFRAPYVVSDDLQIAYNTHLNGTQKLMNHPLESSSWVAIDVDPDETFVFNSELRTLTDGRKNSYKYICVTLREWLEHCRRAEEMKRTLDTTQEIAFRPNSAEPFVQRAEGSSDRFFSMESDNSIFAGLWEIILPQEILAPEHFSYSSKLHQQEPSFWNSCTIL